MTERATALARRQPSATKAFMALVLGLAMLMAQAITARAAGAPDSFADLVEKISPAVVNITTSTTIAAATDDAPLLPEGSPFEDLFKNFRDQENGPSRPRRSQALGSGFVVSEDGFIVTNNHVIEGSDEVVIEFFNGDELKAKVVGTDKKTDIALLKVESDEALPFVPFGDSDLVRVGDWVLAVGNPLGQGFSVSAGIVSARNRELSGVYDDFIQTDAAINRGNSGGPLFNMDGEVIGVNTAILSPTGGSIGIGFSMASNVVTKVVDQLREFGETRRGWLGVRIQDVDQDMAEAIGLDEVAGALVTDVPDGPAKEAGMKAGDVILSFDGEDVADTRELVRIVGDAEVGKTVRVVVFRDGSTQTLLVTLGRREDAEAAVAGSEPGKPATEQVLGMTLSPLTDELREQLGLGEGAQGVVVIDIDEDSEAFEKGLRAGDVISEAGQERVTSVADLEARIADAREAGRKSLLLLVRRDGEPRFVALGLDE
ncbi:MAG TPA: Do family serine endopeptidase [Rhodobacteraceae bacterium]|nr:Do family serine endopeptidase [Paracoccaceae bacterium]